MSDNLSGAAERPIKQQKDDLSEAMRNLSVTTDNSNKTSSSKNLSDMPTDVAGLIIERSDYKEQLVLRKVSKSLRQLVDQQKPTCKSLRFYASTYLNTLWLDEQQVIYTSPISVKIPDNLMKNVSIVVMRNDYEKTALDDLASTLKNPKLQLEEFEFGYDRRDEQSFIDGSQKKLHRQLKLLNRLFTVKQLNVVDVSDLPSILPYLKPGPLKIIKICFDREVPYWNYSAALKAMEQIESLDQWKKAEEFIVAISFEDFPIRYARHFKRFRLMEFTVSNEMLLRMRDYFSKCANFTNCRIDLRAWLDARDIRELHSTAGQPAQPNPRTEYVSHYSIPDSDCYLEFMIFERSVEIRKMKRLNSGF